MARDLAAALELARRVRANVEQTRERAIEAGVPGAATLAADVYDLAAWVLEQQPAAPRLSDAEVDRVVDGLGRVVDALADAGVLRRVGTWIQADPARGAAGPVPAIESDRAAREGRLCACSPVGAGLALACGGAGEYDPPCPCSCHEVIEHPVTCKCLLRGGLDRECGTPARPCRCACHEHDPEAPEVDPRQLHFRVPGCEPPAAQEAPPAPPAAPPAPVRRRAEEQDVAIEDWEPEPMFLSSLQTALEDTDLVRERLAEFRKEKAGQKAKRWPSVFRSWLAKARGQKETS